MGKENHALLRVFFPISAIALDCTTAGWSSGRVLDCSTDFNLQSLSVRVRFRAPANFIFSKYVYWILRVMETGYNVHQIRIQRISDSDITFSGYSVTILSNKAHYYNKLETPGLETIPKGFLKNYPDTTYTESNKNRI